MDRCVRSGLLCRLCIFPVLSIPVGAGVAVGGVWFVLGNELVLAEPAEVGVGFVGVVERLEGVDVERRFAPGGRRGRARARVSLAEEEVVGVRREWMRFVSRAVLLGWPMLVLLVLVQVSCVGRVDGRRSASRGGGGCERRSVSLDGHLGPGGMWEGVLEEDRIGVQLCVWCWRRWRGREWWREGVGARVVGRDDPLSGTVGELVLGSGLARSVGGGVHGVMVVVGDVVGSKEGGEERVEG
jgi:hypothetical protein